MDCLYYICLYGYVQEVLPVASKPGEELTSLAEKELTQIEQKHLRQQTPFAIGQGFEGTASDWTEYVVWLVGVIGVFYYWMHPNARRNRYALDAPQYDSEPGDGDLHQSILMTKRKGRKSQTTMNAAKETC